jgi:hypothetical protein
MYDVYKPTPDKHTLHIAPFARKSLEVKYLDVQNYKKECRNREDEETVDGLNTSSLTKNKTHY